MHNNDQCLLPRYFSAKYQFFFSDFGLQYACSEFWILCWQQYYTCPECQHKTPEVYNNNPKPYVKDWIIFCVFICFWWWYGVTWSQVDPIAHLLLSVSLLSKAQLTWLTAISAQFLVPLRPSHTHACRKTTSTSYATNVGKVVYCRL